MADNASSQKNSRWYYWNWDKKNHFLKSFSNLGEQSLQNGFLVILKCKKIMLFDREEYIFLCSGTSTLSLLFVTDFKSMYS